MRVLKWLGVAVGILLVLAAAIFAVGYARTERHIARVWTVSAKTVPVPGDAASLAEGRKLYGVRCGDCHGADRAGGAAIDDPALGRYESANLTAGEGGVGVAAFGAGEAVRPALKAFSRRRPGGVVIIPRRWADRCRRATNRRPSGCFRASPTSTPRRGTRSCRPGRGRS